MLENLAFYVHHTQDFSSCLPVNLLKFIPKYCFKKICVRRNYISLFLFLLKQFEVRQNDPEQVFEGNIFAQIAAIPQWHALDQTVTLGLVIIIAYGSAHV